MSQKVGKLQQENAKLRDEIKRLKGALKDISQDTIEPIPVKPKPERSPISKDRKKELREEIDSRLNYMIPTKALLRQKSSEGKIQCAVIDPDHFVASFGQEEEEEEKHMYMPKQYLSTNTDPLEATENTEKSIPQETFSTPNSKLSQASSPRHLYTEKTEDSPEFLKPNNSALITVAPQVLKDSFSSFYNDESLNKTLQEKSFNDSLNTNLENLTQPIQSASKKYPESILKTSSSQKVVLSGQKYADKSLLSEIEALRQENTKLRLQLTKTSKPENSRNVRGRSKTKSKSPIRRSKSKSKSRSATPKDLSSRRGKRVSCYNVTVGEGDLTPRRSRHCNTCDHLLSKGYSTIYCGKHGTAKLN